MRAQVVQRSRTRARLALLAALGLSLALTSCATPTGASVSLLTADQSSSDKIPGDIRAYSVAPETTRLVTRDGEIGFYIGTADQGESVCGIIVHGEDLSAACTSVQSFESGLRMSPRATGASDTYLFVPDNWSTSEGDDWRSLAKNLLVLVDS